MDVATFRAVYPSFADLVRYPPEAVSYWLSVAYGRLPPLIWANQLEEGLGLFVAHRLTLADLYASGSAGGPVSSKSIGGVSIAYNTELGTVADGGAYNLTVYGREWLQLARLVGMGGVQL